MFDMIERVLQAIGWRRAGRFLALVGLLGAGCGTLQEAPTREQPRENPNALRSGDTVIIKFAGPRIPTDRHEEEIKTDGRISPPVIEPVKAAELTAGQLQSQLQGAYDEYYKNLTVTVNAGNRYFYVDGEVKNPNRFPHAGEMTVIDAIATASGFTDFAKKRGIKLIRSWGDRHTVNYFQAMSNDEKDLPVYPGDQIFVPRRGIF